MSKTYRRKSHIERDCNCGAPIKPRWSYSKGNISESVQEAINRAKRFGYPPERECECETWFNDYHKRNFKRDRKDYFKPNKVYKNVTKKIRKAKERAAMVNKRYDNIPTFRQSDVWDWN